MLRFLVFNLTFLPFLLSAQYTKEDTIRGSITYERAWWNVIHYDLSIKVDPEQKSIQGVNTILYTPNSPGDSVMQIDLQEPMHIDSIYGRKGSKVTFKRISPTSYHVYLPSISNLINKQIYTLTIYFSGVPIEAKNAPWDGGIVWSKDDEGNDFIASAIQGMGGSVWWPCKDHWSDEPDHGAKITINCPSNLMGISNGNLIRQQVENDRTITTWEVKNPINVYGINFNIGKYVSWNDTIKGESGKLPVSFYVLTQNFEKAKKQFQDVYRMLEAFEHWFGPYPFYEDGYKLVEVPYLGMEHQSSVTYGNGYKNGYKGADLSGTGWGLKWDFIIVHESGHEWFANNITASDPADMWIHESFTTYSECLFVDYFYGKEAGNEYAIGLRRNILNDRPIIGDYDVNNQGSYDMYFKGAAMLHTLRTMVNNDSLWRATLIGMNTEFRHQTVTTEQIENYLSEKLELNLSTFFDQYLRTIIIPELKIQSKGKKKHYIAWSNTVEGFEIPLKITIKGKEQFIVPSNTFQCVKGKHFKVDSNYYITTILTKK